MYISDFNLTSSKFNKVLKSRLVNRSGCYVIHHHIPKSAGTSIASALRWKNPFIVKSISQYAASRVFYNNSQTYVENRLSSYDFMSNMSKYYMEKELGFISGHIPFFEYDPKIFPYKRVTVLREPVSRFLSHYNMALDEAVMVPPLPPPLSPFEEFVKTDCARFWGRLQCIFISGKTSLDIDKNDLVQIALKSAKSFDLIGFQHDIPQFEQNLNNLLNTNIKIKEKNVRNNKTLTKDMFDQKQLKIIEDICRPDIELYNRLLHN